MNEPSIVERYNRYQRAEFDLSRGIRDFFALLFPSYRDELDRYFWQYFRTYENPDGKPTWNLVKAHQLGTFDDLSGQFDELLDATTAEVGGLLTDGLVDGYHDGFDLGLWTMYQDGVDVNPEDVPPDDTYIKSLLLAAGFGSFTYRMRAKAWQGVTQSKFSQWLRGMVASESTLDETLGGLDGITTTYLGRLLGLGGDELYQAYNAGASAAFKRYPNWVSGEVWVTAQDERVCTICRPRHLTITNLLPIVDSHPNCRCVKVPVYVDEAGMLTDPDGRHIEYDEFRLSFLHRGA